MVIRASLFFNCQPLCLEDLERIPASSGMTIYQVPDDIQGLVEKALGVPALSVALRARSLFPLDNPTNQEYTP